MRRTFFILLLIVISALTASAQSETDLKSYFQDKSVTTRIHMPATADGVNVYPERSQSLDYNEYNNRLLSHGTSIRRGERATISKVRVKGNHIEVQLTAQDRTSRFNIQFTRIESWMLTPAGLLDALNRYIEFSSADKAAARLTEAGGYVRNGVIHVGSRTTYLKEGLKTAEVLKLLGEPSTVSHATEDGRLVSTYEFERGEGRVVIAKFVSDSLISSRSEIRNGAVAAVINE